MRRGGVEMKGLLLIILSLLATLVMPQALLYAETDQSSTTYPPLSQPLVREGTLALKLAEALKLSTTEDEAEAQRVLAEAGIVPGNGWIGDYPVTPDIVGELEAAIAGASESGRVVLGKDEALGAFEAVLADFGLSVKADESGEGTDATPEAAYPDTTVIDSYYYDQGSPVVTYYPPPEAYAYLYSWVPYPFWWWDVRFPGFFVLADFDVRIGHKHGHGHRHDHGKFISNHFRDHGRTFRIDPAKRHSHWHRDGRSGDRGGKGWTNPSGRRGAEMIINRSLGKGQVRDHSFGRERGSRSFVAPSAQPSRPEGRRAVPGVSTGRPFSGSGYRGGEPHFDRPAFREPSAGNRAISPPSYSGRTFSSPPAGGRGFSGRSERGFSGRGDGGSFGGGRRR
jgi:hypothetical protein